MRLPWRRNIKPDPAAVTAVESAKAKLEIVEQRQPAIDRLADRMADLARRDRFAEAFEAAIRRRR